MTAELFPRPAPTGDHETYWDWLRGGELRLQRCSSCGHWRFHPRPRCPKCRSAEHTWQQVSGQARVASWTVCHPPVLPAFADRAPYNAIVVELAEGPFMVSNLLGVANEDLEVGMPVELELVKIDDELTLPQWRPTRGRGPAF